MDKSKTIIPVAAALVALVGISGLAFRSFAADSTTVANATNGEAVSGCPMRGGFGRNLSAADKAAFEAKRAEMDAKMTAVNAALDAGDYNAWVKAMPTGAPILTKINESNFPKFAEAHKLNEQARVIYKDLGVDKPERGFGRPGMMRGEASGAPASTTGGTASQAN